MHSKMKTFKLVKIYEFESACYIQAETLEQAQEYALEADEWKDGTEDRILYQLDDLNYSIK